MTESLGQILGGLMAQFQSHDRVAKYPKCGGRLVAHVALYPHTHVVVREWGDGTRKVIHGSKLIETKAALEEEARENYGESQIDEREDLYCENYNRDGGCDYWAKPVEIEFPGA